MKLEEKRDQHGPAGAGRGHWARRGLKTAQKFRGETQREAGRPLIIDRWSSYGQYHPLPR